jgi:glycerophosphoryl diester phosphodiesterase
MHSKLDSDFFTPARPRIFAHRGFAGEYPENTMVSFRAAADAGARYFELDVHMTRDGEIVVSHDENLGRMCDRLGLIREMTWAEVARADAGYRFSPDGGGRFPFRGRAIAVPRLAEVLGAFSSVQTLIEIKQDSPSLVARMLGVIDRAAARKRVLVASEQQVPIDELRALAPGIPTNLPYGEVAEFMQALAARDGAYRPRGDALQVPPDYQGWNLITAESVAFAHRAGLEVHAWTINNESEMRALLALGVDGLITDYPARALAAAAAPR